MLVLALMLPLHAAPQEGAALTPTAAEASAPAQAQAATPALTLDWRGLDAALVDPRDAGLLAALRQADDRLLQLAAQPSWDGPPTPMLRYAFDLLAQPFTLSISVPEAPSEEAPFTARLEVEGGSETVARLAERLPQLLGMPPGEADPDQPGLLLLPTPAGIVRHGVPANADSPRFVVTFGDAPAAGAIPAARGARAMGMAFDLGALEPLMRMAAQSDRDAQQALSMMESFGYLGEDAMRGWMQLAHADGLAHLTSRIGGLQAMLERLGAPIPAPLTPQALAKVPQSASYAQVTRFAPETLPGMLDMLAAQELGADQDPRAMFREATGLDLEQDLIEPLGDLLALYLSDEGGGGFLSATLALSVDDTERLANSIETLAAMGLPALAQESGGRVRLEDWQPKGLNGARGWRLVFPELPVPFEPSFLFHEGWLHAALFPSTALNAALQGPASPTSLATNPRYQRALQDLGERPAVGVQWSDTPEQLRGGYPFVRLGGKALDNLLLVPGDAPRSEHHSLVPPLEELLAGARPSLLLTTWEGEEVVTEGVLDGSMLTNASGVFGSYVALMFGIGLTSAVATPNLMMAQELAAAPDPDYAQAQVLVQALEQFAIANAGRYPASLQELVTPDADGAQYLTAIPTDKWGHPLVYIAPTEDAPWPTVMSYGADGQEGGYGPDEDLFLY